MLYSGKSSNSSVEAGDAIVDAVGEAAVDRLAVDGLVDGLFYGPSGDVVEAAGGLVDEPAGGAVDEASGK